jgi:hypothetical protein
MAESAVVITALATASHCSYRMQSPPGLRSDHTALAHYGEETIANAVDGVSTEQNLEWSCRPSSSVGRALHL